LQILCLWKQVFNYLVFIQQSTENLNIMVHDEYEQLRNYIAKFIQVTDDEWKLHRQCLSIRKFKKGDFLLQVGQVCNHVSFINYGFFRTYTENDGAQRTTNFSFEENYVTDYCSFLTRMPSTDNIQALDDAEVLQLNHHDMNVLYEKIPAWQKFGRLIAEFIFIGVAHRSQTLLLQTPEELYVNLMKERPKVLERVPQIYIASYLGIQPESLSRIRKRLSEQKSQS